MDRQAGSYRAFLAKAGLILVGGLLIMLVFTVAIVVAREGQEMGRRHPRTDHARRGRKLRRHTATRR